MLISFTGGDSLRHILKSSCFETTIELCANLGLEEYSIKQEHLQETSFRVECEEKRAFKIPEVSTLCGGCRLMLATSAVPWLGSRWPQVVGSITTRGLLLQA